MKYDFLKFGLPTAASLFLAAGAVAQVNNPETEPNETKATATVAASGGAGMVAGDTISGTTTGASATAGATSLDTFRVKTAAAALGIYKYRLQLSSDTLFQTASVRGLAQAAGVPTAGGDVAFQTAAVATRFVQWYGFGRQEELFVRITGSVSSTASYGGTLSRDRIDPVEIAGSISPGAVTVRPDAATATALDTDFWVYDSNFDAIPGFGHDDVDNTGATRDLVPGTYYVAMSNFNLANNLGSPADDTYRTGNVLDFPNVIATSSGATNAVVTVEVVGIDGAVNSATSDREAFGICWFSFTVEPSVNPLGSGAASPIGAANDGTGSSLFTVRVTPGINPVSTGITVNGDLSAIGGSAAQQFFDNGSNGDVTAGDGTFSYFFSIPDGAATGAVQLPFAVADAQGRGSNGLIAFSVIGPPSVIEDLGNVSTPPVVLNRTTDVPANGVSWYRFSLSQDASAGLGTFLDLDTEGSAGDTELGVYRVDGTLVVSDDDDGSGLLTQISFGAGGRPAVGTSAAYNGRDGTLPAGVYYLAVAQFNAAFTNNFTVTSTGGGLFGVQVNLRSATEPVAPSGAGVAVPSLLGNDGSFSTTLRVTVTPGSFPPSTNLAVTVDATSVGGSGTLVLLDNGVAPDVTAGDNIFSVAYTVPAGVAEGPNAVPFTITDGELRTGSGTINTTIFTPVGACCTTNGCSIKSRALCDAEGGTYLGNSTQCSTGDGYPIAGSARVFESVSADANAVRLTLTDDSSTLVDLGFDFTFFGNTYAQVFVSSNGFVTFDAAGAATLLNAVLPAAGAPNNAIYGFWDDLNPGAAGAAAPNGVYTLVRGEAPNREFVVSHEGIPQFANTDSNSFQIILHESGRVDLVYGTVTQTVVGDVTIGIENTDGTSATSIDSQSIGTGNTARTAVFTPGTNNCPSGCAPDFNGDGTLDPDDLADFINAFFAQPPNPAADYDNSGSVDPDDLSTYITEFFAGCP